jgi:multidrug efflux system outer membrane protein
MRIGLLAPLLLIAACSLAPDTQLPTDRIPETYRQETATARTTPPWQAFKSTELDALIAQALGHNTDIEAALARVAQARANARISGADRFPQLNGSGDAGRNYTDGSNRTDSASASLAVSYEVDLWLRNRNQYDAAMESWRASTYDHAAQTLLVSSEVARLYTGVLAYEARLAVAQKNLQNALDVLRITEARHGAGSISGLELAQQRTSVANTRATIAGLTNQRQLFFNELAQMVGVAPSALQLRGDGAMASIALPTIDTGAPWALLEHRPDIAAAEARLRSANIAIGVARADALPSLSLALNAGVVANPSTAVTGLAASFFAPIFQGGRLQGAIENAEAARDERIASYQGVLLNAFREVEDALSTLETAATQDSALAQAASEARKAEAIARARYKLGSIDFTTLLATQATLLQTEDSAYSARQSLIAAHIDLIRALGGPAQRPQAAGQN